MRKFIFILVIFPVLTSSSLLHAQPFVQTDSYYTYTEVKDEIGNLLQENRKLEKEYKASREEYLRIQKEMADKRGEIQQLKRAAGNSQTAFEKRNDNAQFLNGGLEDLENELLVKETNNQYLTDQLLAMDQRERLWKLQQADLSFQKQELEMQLKLKEIQVAEVLREKEAELRRLESELRESMEQEEKIMQEMRRLRAETEDVRPQIDKLSAQNEDLRKKLRRVEENLLFKKKELELLKRKRLYQIKSVEQQLWDKDQERARLEADVNTLETEYQSLDTKLNESLSSQNKKQQLIADVIQIDQENQLLREKINAITEKIDSKRSKP